MTRYQMGKLVQWAGTLRSRKRLQKIVYLLQVLGCKFDVDYTLHHYGPYSQDVARLSDEMTRSGFLHESIEYNNVGESCTYSLNPGIENQLTEVESTETGKIQAVQMRPFENAAKEFLNTKLRELELAATLVYFKCKGFEWDAAVKKTCEFKKVQANDRNFIAAKDLATNPQRFPHSWIV